VLLALSVAGTASCAPTPPSGRATAAVPSPSPTGQRPGGVLRLVYVAGSLGRGGTAVVPDPALATTAAARQILRATSRQLVSYDPVDSLGDRQDPKPDLATFPDISDDKTTFTFRLRDVRYPAPLDRPLRAADVVHAVQRLCDPNAPSPGRALFTRRIVGLADFCTGLLAIGPGDPAAVARYQGTHPIAGVTARDAHTIIFVVNAPAGDFLNALALPFVTPLPGEADTPAVVGLGPYVVAPGAGAVTTLVRSPSWQPDSDPLRRAWADRLELRPVATAIAGAVEVAAGRADLLLGGTSADEVRSAIPGAVPGAVPAADPRVRSTAAGVLDELIARPGAGSPCGVALTDPRVRDAVALAADRRAAADAAGGPELARPATSLLPAGVLGHGTTDVFATPGSAGDPVSARALLAAAVPAATPAAPLTCRLAVERADPRLSAVGVALRAPLRTVGLDLRPRRGGERADLVLRRWTAPWHGNSGRDLLEGLLAACPTVADGCYGGAGARAAAAAALELAAAENDQNRAAKRWAEAAVAVGAAVPVIPLVQERVVSLVGERVRGFRWFGLARDADPVNVAVPSP